MDQYGVVYGFCNINCNLNADSDPNANTNLNYNPKFPDRLTPLQCRDHRTLRALENFR